MSSATFVFDVLGDELPSFTLRGDDDFAASLLDLWIKANQNRGVFVFYGRDEACLDAMRNVRYLQRKQEIDVLDHVPIATLVAALRRRGEPHLLIERWEHTK